MRMFSTDFLLHVIGDVFNVPNWSEPEYTRDGPHAMTSLIPRSLMRSLDQSSDSASLGSSCTDVQTSAHGDEQARGE